MILHQFPDLAWLKQQAEQRFVNRKAWGGGRLPAAGWPTVILNTHSCQTVRDNIRGPLSIFMNISGESIVSAGPHRAIIGNDLFFITNHDQYYTLEIDQPKATETFNIHIGEYAIDQVRASIVLHPEKTIGESLSSSRPAV